MKLRTLLLRAAILPATFGAASSLLIAFGPTAPTPAGPDDPVPDPAVVLIQQHDCWTDDPPPGQRNRIPGHTVVTLSEGITVYSRRWVGPALDTVFDDPDPRIATVHAFCK